MSEKTPATKPTPFIDANALVDRLWRGGHAVRALVNMVSAEDALWRPEDGGWSITEIVWHMADEEVEDFRLRVRLTLDDPTDPWPPIDPEGWARARNYQDKPVQQGLAQFLNQRGVSIAWLRSLRFPEWSKTHIHPKLGPMRAGDVLAAWAAHDVLHLRQITKRIYQITQRDAGGYSTKYAGEWKG